MGGIRAALVAGAAVVIVVAGAPVPVPRPAMPSLAQDGAPAIKTLSLGVESVAVPSAAVKQPPSVDCRKVKCVALTFDDGPVPQTNEVLDVLRRRGARATFFVLGSQARNHPEVLRRMVAGGNAVGNHSWSHPMLSRLSLKASKSQLNATENAITAAIGPHQRLVRSPYGQDTPKVLKLVRGFGAPLILWSVDPEDWKYRNTGLVTKKVLGAVRRNSIVLLHDIHPTSRGAVAGIVDQLQAKGYVLVTVPELLGSKAKPGARIANG